MPCWRAIGRFANSSSMGAVRGPNGVSTVSPCRVAVVVAAGGGEGGQEGA